MKSIHRKLLLVLVTCAIIISPVFTAESRLHAAPKRLKCLEQEFIEIYNETRESVAAVLSGNQIFTGFFISEDGLMLTNGDLEKVAATNPIVIHLDSDERRSAELVSTDPYNHICLIRVEGSGYKAMDLGHSREVRVGQFAMTVGNVFGSIQNGEQPAFSVGTVSGLYRLTGDSGYSGNVIETDAAVNAGVEGGPLVDIRGRVIGVAAKGYSRSRFLGTAVPIDQVKMVLEDLKLGRTIYSGYLGMEFENTVITAVDGGSPAARAGLKKGDKITEIDTVLINTDDDIRRVLGNSPAGSTANISVKRSKEEIILRVTLDKGIKGKEIKPPTVVMGPGPSAGPGRGTPWIGFSLVDKGGGRVEVLKVTPGSPAAKAGITPGLRLLKAGGRPIGSVAAFEVVFRSVRANQELVLTMENREGWRRDFKVKVSRKLGKEF